ncbi:neuronal acetylcholine receptor subunit alpha-9-like [Amphiura filiformis]|uniref:neuronal acetylcholine receptor subunit alpha-9-like n=1 Tax=Amphiura filiformis TaxID=82378 RepID=UPI003B2167C4
MEERSTTRIAVVIFSLALSTMVLMASATDPSNYQLHLMEHLMDNYGRGYARPVYDSQTPTKIIFRCLLGELIEMDTRQQKLTVSAYLKMTWTDEFLTWNSSEWGNITSLHIPAHAIWFPDLSLYNNVDKGWMSLPTGMHLVAYPDGTVKWYSPVILTSSCRQRVRYFPFDTQVCLLRFCSWSAHSRQIDFWPEEGSDSVQSRFLEDGTWRFMNLSVERVLMPYACCPHPFSELFYHVLFRRRSDFYVTYLILPCVLLSVLSLMVFYLPSDCGEKLTLSITNLLALVVFQQMISETMPPSGDDAPILGTYFTIMIIMVCISVLLTVIIIHFGFSIRPMPRWVEYLIIENLGKVFCLSKIDENAPDFDHDAERIKNDNEEEPKSNRSEMYTSDLANNTASNGVKLNSITWQETPTSIPELAKIVQQLEYIKKSAVLQNKMEVRSRKWKLVATVIDRTLLYSFIILAVTTTVVMMTQVKTGGETDYLRQYKKYFGNMMNTSTHDDR